MFDLKALLEKGFFIWPVRFRPVRITARFGDSNTATEKPVSWAVGGHEGFDLSVPDGTAVMTMARGLVVKAGEPPGNPYGARVVIEHDAPDLAPGWKLRTWYCHLSAIGVREGEYVEQGDVLGSSGHSGNSFGPHLHVGVQIVPPLIMGLPETLRGLVDPLDMIAVPES